MFNLGRNADGVIAPLTLAQVEAPLGGWCKAGHYAKEVFLQSDGKPIPMRFFKATGDVLAPEHRGIYCEECLAVANKMSRAERNLFRPR